MRERRVTVGLKYAFTVPAAVASGLPVGSGAGAFALGYAFGFGTAASVRVIAACAVLPTGDGPETR